MAGRWPHVYLDVETDGPRQRLTVVGFQVGGELHQLVGEEIIRRRLMRQLPERGWLYTFNGDAFDLRLIRQQLGCDLEERLESVDLMKLCRGCGLRGRQKEIEKRIGFSRHTTEVNGRGAIRLWRQYVAGELWALEELLSYNAEDLAGLWAVRRHLATLGAL